MRAVCANQSNVVNMLLDAGADATRSDRDGNTILSLAVLNELRPMLVSLLRRREELKLDVDERNFEKKSIADLVGGKDLLDRLLNEADKR
jgi:ankyrin repeat protein